MAQRLGTPALRIQKEFRGPTFSGGSSNVQEERWVKNNHSFNVGRVQGDMKHSKARTKQGTTMGGLQSNATGHEIISI